MNTARFGRKQLKRPSEVLKTASVDLSSSIFNCSSKIRNDFLSFAQSSWAFSLGSNSWKDLF